MTDEQIIDIILNDLKAKSPRHLIADILKPNDLWNTSEEQRFKNIFSLLKTNNLITTSSDKYFGATDIELTITGGLKYNSYSDFLEMENHANTPTQVTNIDKRHIGDKTTNVFNNSTIGQVNQDSSFSDSPQTMSISPDQKQNLTYKIWNTITNNKLVTGIILIIIGSVIEHITIGKMVKYIFSIL